jgi:hypothetical protein
MSYRLDRTELIALVHKIRQGGTEDEIDNLISALEANVDDPDADWWVFNREMTAEAAGDKILSYPPIILPYEPR